VIFDCNNLFKAGMVALSAKLSSVSDDLLCSKMTGVWSNFYCNIIPNMMSALIPIRQEACMLKAGKKIDLRKLILVSFKDYFIWPMRNRLTDALEAETRNVSSDAKQTVVTDIYGKLRQMMATLNSLNDGHRLDVDLAIKQLFQRVLAIDPYIIN
jgi:hypothetical protein